MAKAYKIKRADRAATEVKVGQVVFSYDYNTYGVESEDTRISGITYKAIAIVPNDSESSFFTIPIEDLTPVIHHEMVKDLVKDPAAILDYFRKGSQVHDEDECNYLPINLMHMGIGIADEYFEFLLAENKADRENMLEELGDWLFYTEGLLLFAPFTREYAHSIIAIAPISVHETMQLTFETIKRHSLYEKDLDTAKLLRAYLGNLSAIGLNAAQYGFTLEQIQDANMCKLGVRYRDFCYSNKAAHKRADKAQQEEIEDQIDAASL